MSLEELFGFLDPVKLLLLFLTEFTNQPVVFMVEESTESVNAQYIPTLTVEESLIILPPGAPGQILEPSAIENLVLIVSGSGTVPRPHRAREQVFIGAQVIPIERAHEYCFASPTVIIEG